MSPVPQPGLPGPGLPGPRSGHRCKLGPPAGFFPVPGRSLLPVSGLFPGVAGPPASPGGSCWSWAACPRLFPADRLPFFPGDHPGQAGPSGPLPAGFSEGPPRFPGAPARSGAGAIWASSSQWAVFRIFSHRSGKEIPMAAAALGIRLVAVIPGMVLTSRAMQSPLSASIRSVRATPLQPRAS